MNRINVMFTVYAVEVIFVLSLYALLGINAILCGMFILQLMMFINVDFFDDIIHDEECEDETT